MASTFENGYLALRQAMLHGGELTFAQKAEMVLALRSAATVETAIAAQIAQAVTLQAALDAHATAWAAVVAVGEVVDGTRAAAATAIDAAIVTSQALQTAWDLHIAILAKTAIDADDALLDTLGALDPGVDTSADFNTAIGNVVTARATAVTAANLVLDPVQAIAAEFPVAVPALAATPVDAAL